MMRALEAVLSKDWLCDCDCNLLAMQFDFKAKSDSELDGHINSLPTPKPPNSWTEYIMSTRDL